MPDICDTHEQPTVIIGSWEVTEPSIVTIVKHDGTTYNVYSTGGTSFITRNEMRGKHEVEVQLNRISDEDHDLYWLLIDKVAAYRKNQ